MPPSNAYLTSRNSFSSEESYPLNVMVCDKCWLVQTEDFTQPEQLFTKEYAYFSSTSSSWIEHAKSFVEELVQRRSLDKNSFVVELAANDGYLLDHVVRHNIPCLGIEPTAAVAAVAKSKGISIEECFFGLNKANELLEKYPKADVIIANNVLAHVPDINDFVAGIKRLLSDYGIVSFEFPHLLNLIKHKQFDTVYHEHYSYLSLSTVQRILSTVGLEVVDVEKLPTHGGSLRVWAQKKHGAEPVRKNVLSIIEEESSFGLLSQDVYKQFPKVAESIANELRAFLKEAEAKGKKVVAYGAAAKGNTLLNFANIGVNQIEAVFDAAPSKQGKWLPGSHIPILPPEKIAEFMPDIVLILPWNISNEVVSAIQDKLPEHCEFIVAVPKIATINRRLHSLS